MTWSEIKEMTEAIKNICVLVVYLVIAYIILFIILPKININDLSFKGMSMGGIEIGLKEKEAIKTIDSVQNTVPNQGRDTTKILLPQLNAAKLLDTTINVNNQNWVYVGQIINGKLKNSHFRIQNIPEKGDIISAIDAVYKRKDLPVELKNGDWKLGAIRGVVKDNEYVKVSDIKEISGKNYWALVK
jgi:hypothetical protein